MSRNIAEKTSVRISSDEAKLRNTSKGKLIFTEYHGKKCAMLINDSRLKAVSFPDEGNSKIGAVYIGKVKNVVSNINACFVEIADKEICFLPFKEASVPLVLNRKYDGRILAGDELPVQVVQDAQKTKQASVTARISISNDYFALESGSDRVNFSLKLDKSKKNLLTELLRECGIMESNTNCLSQSALQFGTDIMENLRIPVGMIVRTKAGELSDITELKDHFQPVASEFMKLFLDAFHRSCFSCLKDAPSPLESVITQLVASNEFDEFVTDDEEVYRKLCNFAIKHMPEKKVRLYEDKAFPIQSLYSLDTKMETALSERVWLKSGGYLIIQPTEALTVIDVNSGKYEAKKGSEETALKMNLEAAEEISIQLRLRNLSGIIIVDFINMKEEASRQELLRLLKTFVSRDKLPTKVVDITPLGLVELTRKKERKPLYEQIRFLKNITRD